MKKSNNVLVIGGAGFVGTNLIEELIKRKDIKKIYSYDDYSTGLVSNHLKFKNIKYLKGSTLNINKNAELNPANKNPEKNPVVRQCSINIKKNKILGTKKNKDKYIKNFIGK